MTTALIPRTTVTEICAQRDAAMTSMRRAVEAMQSGSKLAEESHHYAQLAHGAATFTLSDRSKSEAYRRLFEGLDADRSLEAYRQQVDARVWMNLLALTGMESMMDRTAKEQLYKQLCDAVPEVTEETVYATFESLAGDAQLIFQRGLARAFIDLDRRFRSHDAFKIGARIILTRVFDEWGSWSYWTGSRDTICDVERVFAVLDGNRPDPRGLITAIDQGRKGGMNTRQSTTEATYFRINTFKNGNAHLWFTRDDLVEKANMVLAEYYGEVLPDGVPPDVTDADIRAKSTAICKDLSFYPTPDKVIETLLNNVHIDEKSHVLEPQAGTGNIVRALLAKGARVDAVEVDPGRVGSLRTIAMMGNLTVTHANFLQTPPRPIYSHVIMNPPFYGQHYMQHVMHAFEFLAPGGTLISVLPGTVEFGETKAHDAFRAWLKKHSERCYGNSERPFHDLPLESFSAAGTRVNTVYVRLQRSR